MPRSSGGHRDTQGCRGLRIAAFLANYREDFHIASPTVLHAFRYRCFVPYFLAVGGNRPFKRRYIAVSG